MAAAPRRRMACAPRLVRAFVALVAACGQPRGVVPVAPDAAERQWQQTRWNLAGERCVFWASPRARAGRNWLWMGVALLSEPSKFKTEKTGFARRFLRVFATPRIAICAQLQRKTLAEAISCSGASACTPSASSRRTAVPALLSFDDI